MDALMQDLRYAAHSIKGLRGAGLAAILTLALGIAATTTIFSLVYAALTRPLPFQDPDRLVMLYTTRSTVRDGVQRLRWSNNEIGDLVNRQSPFRTIEDLGSFTSAQMNVTSDGDPEQVSGEVVSPGYLRVLRVAPIMGRSFRRDDDVAVGAQPVALISARLWQRRFRSDRAILGRSISVNQVPLTIIGVLGEAFAGLSGRADIWIPTTLAPALTYAGYLTTPQHFINLIGRLKADADVPGANAEFGAIAPRVVRPETAAGAEPGAWSAAVVPLAVARIDSAQRRSAVLLLAATACLLLTACVNVGCLLLARSRARRREIAIRNAIGASRMRLARQLLTESLLLATIGGVLGTLLAAWGVRLISLPAIVPSSLNAYAQVAAFSAPRLDGVVVLFAVAVTFATTIVFGLVPTLQTSRPDLTVALNESARMAAGRGQTRLLAGLVVSEIALAVLLVAAAGLLLKSFVRIQALRAGFVVDGVVTFWVNPPASRYTPGDGPAIVERLLTRVQQVPGVLSATVNRCAPLSSNCARTTIFFPGRENDSAPPTVGRHYVSADYFQTLGIPLRDGRALTNRDRAGGRPVAVINEAAAQRFWPDENPIGKRVWFGSGTGFTDPTNPVEVVGVVGDVKYGALDEPRGPDFYTSYLQFTYPDTMMVVRIAGTPASIVGSLRRAVASVDPGLPIYDVQTLDDRIAQTLSRPRFNASVVTLFAAAALLLAAGGVYAVMAYSVSSRMHEIGIRLALGADATRVLRLVLGEGARLAGLGAAVGIAAAIVIARLMRSVLFGIADSDPVVMSSTVMIMFAVAIAAALVPARRASAIDPVAVLRRE